MAKAPKWIFELAEFEISKSLEPQKLSTTKEHVNNLATLNEPPFAPIDIGITKVMELCKTPREEKLLIAFHDYEKAYLILHLNVKVYHQELSLHDIAVVRRVHDSLLYLDALNLLTDNLDNETLKYLESIL